MPYGDIALTTQTLASSSSAAGAVTTTLTIASDSRNVRYIFAYCGAQGGAGLGTITLNELGSKVDSVTVFSSSGQHVPLHAPIKTQASNSMTLVVVGNNSTYASIQFAYV